MIDNDIKKGRCKECLIVTTEVTHYCNIVMFLVMLWIYCYLYFIAIQEYVGNCLIIIFKEHVKQCVTFLPILWIIRYIEIIRKSFFNN